MPPVHRPTGSQSTHAPIGSVTAALLLPNHGGITAPNPPAGPPAATTNSRSGDSSAAYSYPPGRAPPRACRPRPIHRDAPGHARVNERGDVRLAPPGRLHVLTQPPGDDQRIVARPDRIMPDIGPHLRGKSLQDLLRVGGPFEHDLTRRPRRHDRDGRDLRRQPALHEQRPPATGLLILRDAITGTSRDARGWTDRCPQAAPRGY